MAPDPEKGFETMSNPNEDEPSIDVRVESIDEVSARLVSLGARGEATCVLGSGDLEVVHEPADPRIGTVIADRYRILERIGSGGIGHVYKVQHTRIGKLCAMKVLSNAHARDAAMDWRFRREALAVSKLESPNTVQVFDFGAADGASYLVMELVRGETLGALLNRNGPLAPVRVLKIAIQVCSSLAEAHEAGIIHRDIKPDNVMIVRAADGADVVKVVDFGLAKLQLPHETANEVTSRGAVLGTPHYMAPEQILGEPVDARTDIYALGGLLYRILSGHFPFEGKPIDVLRRSLVETPRPLVDHDPTGRLPTELVRAVERCLHKDPDRRFQSVAELRDVLVACLKELTSAASVHRLLDPRWVERAGRAALGTTATRDDVDAYERRLRGRRTGLKVAVAAATIASATAIGGWAWQSQAATPVTVEREPNDDPDGATRIALGTTVRAQIGKRIDREHGDRDHFLFELERDEPVRIALGALPNMPLCAVLYRSGLLEPIGRACGAAGVDVALDSVPLPQGRYVLVVHQDMAPEPGAKGSPRVVENVSDDYTVSVSTER